MKSKISITLGVAIMLCLVSSFFFKKEHKDVDPFYTINHFGQFHILPLLKPITLLYDPSTKEWWLNKNNLLKQNISNEITEIEIGVEKTYIFWKIIGRRDTIEGYTSKDYVFLDKYGVISYGPSKIKTFVDEIEIYPTDSIHKIFIIPERWFVINVADSTTEAFFSKKNIKTT